MTSSFGASCTSGYNDVSVAHTPAALDNFAIVVTWQMQVDAANGAVGYPPTPGAPTYGGIAMTYVGTAAVYSDPPGDGNSSHRGVWAYYLNNIPRNETKTVAFTPTTNYRGSIGVITGRWIISSVEDTVVHNNQGGGSYSQTLDPTTVGAFTVHVMTGADNPSGDGTEAWAWTHDEDDNRWDCKFNAEYFVATGVTKTYDALTAGTNGHFYFSLAGDDAYFQSGSGALSFAGALTRKAKKILNGVLTFIGQFGGGYLASTLQVLVRIFKKPAPTFEIEPDPTMFVEVIPDPDVNINTNLELNV